MSKMVESLMERSETFVRATLLEDGKPDLPPMAAVVMEGGRVEVIAIPWNSADERGEVLAALRILFQKTNAIAYAIATEAWSIRRDAPFKPGAEQPSKAKDRVEVVSIIAVDRESAKMRILEMKRNPKGRLIDLTPFGEDMNDGFVGGDLAHLLEGTPQ